MAGGKGRITGDYAVVHDRLISKGGSERVAIAIAEALDATLYTAKYEPGKTFGACRDLDIRNLRGLSELKISQFYPLIRMLDAVRFSDLEELSEYDVVWLSGQWAHFAAKNNPNNLAYIHSPPRFIYDLREHVRERFSHPSKAIFDAWAWFWTSLDQRAAKHIGRAVANSENVRKRIRRFYRRDPMIVHPPIDIEKFYRANPRDYFVSINRITPEKGIHIQLDAFKRLPEENLIIVGKAEHGTEYQNEMAKRIERMDNVEWRPSVDDEELAELYAHSKATIHTGEDEDFGISPVESMASSKPCLCINQGGYRETMVDRGSGKTGELINPPYVENLARAVKSLDLDDYDPKKLKERAEKFSEEHFIQKIRELTEEMLRASRG